MWSKLLTKKNPGRGKEKEEFAAAAGPASGHEVDGHRRSASTCSGATAAEASGPEADVDRVAGAQHAHAAGPSSAAARYSGTAAEAEGP